MKLLLLTLAFLCGISTMLFSQTPKYTVGNGEYQNFIIDNTTQTLYGLSTGGNGIGTNTGTLGYPIACQFPSSNTKIKFVAGGLHTGTCIDVSGNVYFTGANEDGSMGNGTTTGSASSFVPITTDSLGNPFTNVTYLTMASAQFTGGAGYGAIIFAIKADGTLWVWGNTQGGYRGDGTYGQVNTRPVQVPLPAGTVITKVLAGNIVIALDSKGNVWTWAGNGGKNCLLGNTTRTDYMTPEILALPSPAKDIAGSGFFSYALGTNGSLYGWGLYLGYLGVGCCPTAGWTLQPSPLLLDGELNLPKPIAKISTNSTSTYAILTDGTLWAWGGNECGQIGNGQDLNYAKYTMNPAPYGGSTPAPYAWNWDMSTAQLQQHKPVQIAPGLNNFVSLSEGACAVFYKFAVDANGQLYAWGRNKYGVLGNGVFDANPNNGNIGSIYPNSWDVPYITAINPFAGGKTILSTSPYCIGNPTANACNIYTIPANTPPSAMINGGKKGSQTVSGVTSVALDGTASTDNVAIVYYIWTQVSGPNTTIISIPSGQKVNILNLVTGTYVFQLKTIDNGWMSDSTTFTLTVNASGAQPPVANAGSDQTITLPVNSATLTGSGSEVNGTIASYQWTQLSGPSTASFGSAAAAQTNVSGLVQGIYSFQLTVTDQAGKTATATVQVTVNAAIVVGPPVASAGSDQTITLPVNSATLTGSGSETNGTIASWQWTQVSGPSTAAFGSATVANTNVSGLVQGVYRFQLTVTDQAGKTASATVQVTVNASIAPGTPVANAGPDQTITLPVNSVTLTGSGSETNGTITAYQWAQVSGPSNATIVTAGQASTTVNGLLQGVYSFQLTVTDNSGITATNVVKVTVNPAVVLPGTPVVNAGSAQTITLPVSNVTLTAIASETNGTIVSYAWTQVSGPAVSTIANAAQASTAVTGLLQGVYSFQITVTDNSGVTASDVVKVTVNAAVPVPGPPSANAGQDQIITLPISSATLTGSGSETNGTIVSYVWTQVSGPSTATFANAAQASTLVSALVQGVYIFKLTVTDNSGVSATDQVNVTVNAAPPVVGTPLANAGTDQTITLPVSNVTLTGSGSETNGTIVSYQWTQVSGPTTATIANAAQASTQVSALVQGVYTFKLTVKDNSGVTATDQVNVTVNAAIANKPPVAIAGPDQVFTMPFTAATLNGTASYDPDGTIVKYQWVQISGAGGVSIIGSSASIATVYGLQPGVYVFQLTVTDNNGASASAQVTITVNANTDAGPVANAGNDTTVAYPVDNIMLNGMGSTDAGGVIASYSWTQVSGPSAANLSSSTGPMVVASQLQLGEYVFQLTVTDNNNQSATATVKVKVISNLRTEMSSLSIYPNPSVDNYVTITGTITGKGNVYVSLYDLNGRPILRAVYQSQGAEFQQTLTLPILARGVYMLMVRVDGQSKPWSFKLVKQ